MNKILKFAIALLFIPKFMSAQDIAVSGAANANTPIISNTGNSVSFLASNASLTDITTGAIPDVGLGNVKIEIALTGLVPSNTFSMSTNFKIVTTGYSTNNSSATFSINYDALQNKFTATLNSNWEKMTTVGTLTFTISNLDVIQDSVSFGLSVQVIAPIDANSNTNNDTTFQFTSSSVPLPIDLISFNAKKQSCGKVMLDWATANESNFSHFDIESSIDGSNFELIASNINKNERGKHNFQVAQTNPVIYYRLKMVDEDGRFSFSKVAKVLMDCKQNNISIAPNPASNLINIYGLTGGEKLVLIDAVGKLVLSQINQQVVDISHLPTGNYTMIITDAINSKTSFKLVKQ